MMKTRCQETDCRMKGFVLELKFKSKNHLKSLFKSKMKFDFVFFVQNRQNKNGKFETENFNLIMKNLWPEAKKISIVTEEQERMAKTVDKIAHHLKLVSTV